MRNLFLRQKLNDKEMYFVGIIFLKFSRKTFKKFVIFRILP